MSKLRAQIEHIIHVFDNPNFYERNKQLYKIIDVIITNKEFYKKLIAIYNADKTVSLYTNILAPTFRLLSDYKIVLTKLIEHTSIIYDKSKQHIPLKLKAALENLDKFNKNRNSLIASKTADLNQTIATKLKTITALFSTVNNELITTRKDLADYKTLIDENNLLEEKPTYDELINELNKLASQLQPPLSVTTTAKLGQSTTENAQPNKYAGFLVAKAANNMIDQKSSQSSNSQSSHQPITKSIAQGGNTSENLLSPSALRR